MLTEEEIKEFQEITYKLYKRKLTHDEAEDQLTRMVMAFKLILKAPDDHLAGEVKKV